jgi:tRNA1(Val) A37 N6-methylase TrmN6
MRTYEPGRRFDLIFSNPPYIRKATGFLSRSEEKSAAKHEINGDIEDIMEKTAAWLEPGGRACFVYPEKRRVDLARAADRRGFRIRRFRQVLPRASAPANLFLIELGFATVEPEIMPPLVLFAPDGKYTDEADAIFSGPRS